MDDGPRTGDAHDWPAAPFSASGIAHPVLRRGAGPGVVLVPEVPGATPEVLGLGDRLVDAGFTVVIPSPFGVPGREASGRSLAAVLPRLCVSAEFRAFAVGARRPFADWLRALAADTAARTPGPGVGVIGMCFTGGFALAAAVDDHVLAAVASQPGVPFPIGAVRRADPGMSPDELSRVGARAAAGDLCAMGLRFSEDRVVPRERFAGLRRRLGDAFEVIELDSSPGNAGGFAASAHSVLTTEVRERPGHPAFEARERVVAFLQQRLQHAAG